MLANTLHSVLDTLAGHPYATVFSMFAVGLIVFAYTQRARKIPGLAYPFPWFPFLGNLLHIFAHFDNWANTVAATSEAMGGRAWGFSGCFLGYPVLFIPVDPAIAKHVLHTAFDKYEKGDHLKECLFPLLGHGIFNSDGPIWAHQRKTALAMFSRRQVRDYHTRVFARKAAVFKDWVARAAADANVVDIQAAHFAYTMDSFVEIAFGVSIDTLTESAPFGVAFDVVQAGLNSRFFDPFWRVKRALGFGVERNIARALPRIDAFARDVIDSRLQEMENEDGDTQRKDILSLFLAASLKSGEPISHDELRDVALNFILAGRDTTACALSWTVWEVSQNPDVLARIRDEVDAIAPVDQGGILSLADDPTALYKVLKSLPYLEAVISEALRLHPSVPIDSKLCVEQDTWPDGRVIQPLTTVGYSPYAFGRSTKLWGPNAAVFDPSRWFEPDGVTLSPRSPYKFITFNAGKRLCLGMETAYLESKLLLSTILSEFTPVPQITTADPITTILLPIKGGLPVRIEPRHS